MRIGIENAELTGAQASLPALRSKVTALPNRH